MNLQTAISLLKGVVTILTAASAPGISSALHDQAVQSATQAITLVTQSIILPTLQEHASTYSIQPSIQTSVAVPTQTNQPDQCPTSLPEPAVSSCNGTWTAGYSGSSSGLDCLINWQCVAKQPQTAVSTSTQYSYTGPCPGQILNENYFCLTSIDPIETEDIPAGTPFPSGCYNGPASNSVCNDSSVQQARNFQK